jgi:hypothetical protein
VWLQSILVPSDSFSFRLRPSLSHFAFEGQHFCQHGQAISQPPLYHLIWNLMVLLAEIVFSFHPVEQVGQKSF